MMKTAMRMSVKVVVIPALSNGWRSAIIAGEMVSKMSAMLLTCKPGRRPVRIPVATPNMQKVISRAKGRIIVIIPLGLSFLVGLKYSH